MPSSFISEPITPIDGAFDTVAMTRGEPGLPHRFRWRKEEFLIIEVLERWKEYGDCAHGSGERYVRKHGYRVRIADGTLFRLYFQRIFGRGKFRMKDRWMVQSMEWDCAPSPSPAS